MTPTSRALAGASLVNGRTHRQGAEGALGELNEEQVVGGLFAPEAVVEDADVVAAVGAQARALTTVLLLMA